MDYSSNGIRAGEDLGRTKIILKDGNYRVWSVVTEDSLRQFKLWGYVMATAIRPPEAGAVTAAVAGVPAANGQLAVMAVPGIS